jgi:hypothetical protein
MAKRFALVWIFALAPVLGVNSGTARAQDGTGYQQAFNLGSDPGQEAAPPAPATPPAADPSPVKDAASVCPVCGGGCNSCSCDKCGACFNWDKDTFVKVGAGLRASFDSVNENFAGPGGHGTVDYFNPDNMRLYFNGQGHQYIGFEFNTDIFDPTQTYTTPNNFAQIRVLDAIVKFQFNDYVNIWLGRLLPPSDRANLDGPFFLNVWDYPFVSNYPSVFDGRENGVAYWGQVGGGFLKWQVGAFNGTQPIGSPDSSDNLQFAGRVTLNLLDPEPGYYNQSSYYGKKDILAIGIAAMAQRDAVGTSVAPADFFAWNVDFLFEKRLENGGVPTVEAAYYVYDDHNGVDTTLDGIDYRVQQGRAGFVTLAYLVPYDIGVGKMCGRFQPFCRWQKYNHEFNTGATSAAAYNAALGKGAADIFSDGLDIGTNYVIAGHNALLTAFWGQRDLVGGDNYSLFRVGAQVQF